MPEFTEQNSDLNIEQNIRPAFLDEYIGQKSVVDKLKVFLEAAKIRGDVLDHALLAGPPGLGKTTLANIIAKEMGSNLHTLTGPNIEKKGDLATVLTNLQPNDVLFIDEIHRLHRAIEEVLYSAMEDFRLDLIMGQGAAARTLKIELPKFTLVGATTRMGLLTNPLRDRFGVQLRLEYYPAQELEKIVVRAAKILHFEMDAAGAFEIAKRARGTPRIAVRLLRRVRDFAHFKKAQKLTLSIAQDALHFLDIDSRGLDSLDRRYLKSIVEKFNGGPVGLETIVAAVGEESGTLKEVVEPFLLQEGFIHRTPQGRVATKLTYEHLGLLDQYRYSDEIQTPLDI